MNFLELSAKKVLSRISPPAPKKLPPGIALDLTFCDVGGADGLPQEVEWLAPHLDVIVFEPDPRSKEKTQAKLQSLGVRSLNLIDKAVDKTRSVRTLYLTKKPQCSSFYKPNLKLLGKFPMSERFEIEKSIELNCTSLGELSQNIDWLKVDTQGSEFDIISGIESRLEQVIGIDLEIEFLEMYQEQPLISDILKQLSGTHCIVRMDPVHWKPLADHEKSDILINSKGRTVFSNTLWLNKRLLPESFHPTSGKEVLKAVVILLSHRQFALAQQILDMAFSKHLISEKEKSLIHAVYHRKSLHNWFIKFFMKVSTLQRKIKNDPYNFDDE